MIVTGDLRKTRTTHYRFIDVEDAPDIVVRVFSNSGGEVYYRPHRVIVSWEEDVSCLTTIDVRSKSRSGYDMTHYFVTNEECATAGRPLAPQWILDMIAEDPQ